MVGTTPPIRSSHVLAIDALGFAERLERSNDNELAEIWQVAQAQYHRFRASLPNLWVVNLWRGLVLSSGEFEATRLNDMFIVHSRRHMREEGLRYLIAGSLLYQQLLCVGFIPRGGLGVGPLMGRRDLLIGPGFVDAYRQAEKRAVETRNICAVQVSPGVVSGLRTSSKAHNLLCAYRGHHFIHPWALRDPELGPFDKDRVLQCLGAAGTNSEKLDATAEFLEHVADGEA